MSNHLINETSPYLLQHAHNPVNWYPWGEEALARAVAEDKPILVSIGYAACHWCHVMERESFEDANTAELMNRYFINIKIDREERPDLDHIYMDAVQAMTGSGGWPLNVFLTPERKPFYGGTYFPPVPAFNRASWKDVLEGVHKGYLDKKDEIVAQAENLTQHLLQSNTFGAAKPGEKKSAALFSNETMAEIAQNILKNADTTWGGFGSVPKFPQTFCIQYLLRQYHFSKDKQALDQALLSLDKMIDGGIFDQLGGGFARYSTDEKWLAPHFEKMLYDNALILMVMAEAAQITHNPYYTKAIDHTLSFIEKEMTDHEGGFYSALDADSEGVEGKFYTWQKKEIDTLLGEQSELFCDFYGVTEAGNWEHTNILWVQIPLPVFAKQRGITVETLDHQLATCREKLLAVRSKRIRPALDDKILLGWNALMNAAYAKAYAATGNAEYREKAIRNMQFLEEKFTGANGNWFHTYKQGQAKIPAFLDDYAYLIQAYIHLQEMTGNSSYLLKAKELTIFVVNHFTEESTGFFFYTHQEQTDVVVRKKEVYDGATPSGNAVMAANLLYLSLVFDRSDWREHGQDLMLSLGQAIIKYPTSFGVWAAVAQLVTRGYQEIAVIGQHAEQVLGQLLRQYVPDKILQSGAAGSADFPLLMGKTGPQHGEKALFYLCKNYACKEPFTKIENLLANV